MACPLMKFEKYNEQELIPSLLNRKRWALTPNFRRKYYNISDSEHSERLITTSHLYDLCSKYGVSADYLR